ncbi:MAG: hypothetical protein AAGF20_12630 [Pseudomonadota bacterium]
MTPTPLDLQTLRERINREQRKAIVFYHIHKTGGSTVARAFIDNFAGAVISLNTPEQISDLERRIAEGFFDKERPVFFTGHLARQALPLIESILPVFGFTLLRRPLGLFQSDFSFQHTRHGQRDLTTIDFMNQRGVNAFERALGRDLMAAAEDPDDMRLCYCGTFERLEASFSILAWLFDLDARAYMARNITKPSDFVEIDPDLIEDILRENFTDLIFYERAASRNERLIQSYETDLGGQIIRFHRDGVSYHEPTQINPNLRQNNDKMSLLMTGEALINDRPRKALACFDKAFDLDWKTLNRIVKTLRARRARLLGPWLQGRLDALGDREDAQASALRDKLKRLMP